MTELPKRKSPRQYDEEYKREAVRLYESSNKSVCQVSRELGIADNNLRKWITKFGSEAEQSGAKGERTYAEILEENRQLHKRLAERAEEVEILKKATAFFAHQTRR
jgi:transposase